MKNIYPKELILEKLHSTEFNNFIKNFPITTVILFGSICTDEFHEESDVDLAILSYEKIDLDNLLDMELFLEDLLSREIDVIDINSETLDILMKVNILSTGNVIFSSDDEKSYDLFCDKIDRIYRENENFMYFRRMDLLS